MSSIVIAGDTSGTCTLQANAVAGTTTLTLPTTSGTLYAKAGGGAIGVADGGTGATTLTGVLKGNGTSAFTAAVAGTDYVAPGGALGTPSSGTLTNCTGYSASNLTTGTLPAARLPTGSVLQVVSTAKTDTFTTTSNTLTSVTGLTATITPTSSSSKILVLVTMSVGTTFGSTAIMTGLLRGSTNLLLGDAAGSRKQAFMTQTGSNNNFQLCISMAYLDSPASTSSLTYAASIACQEGNSTTVCVNRSGADPDASYASRTASTITVMEIAA